MAQMAEYICRVNCGIRDEAIDPDFKDGEISFKNLCGSCTDDH